MAITYNCIKKAIERYGLKPASQRELPLFTTSCIALGYTKLLKKEFGISFGAVAAFGGGETAKYLFNERKAAANAEKLIKAKKLNRSFLRAGSIYKGSEIIFKKARNTNNDKLALEMIANAYPEYMCGIGLYNCFWRFSMSDRIYKLLSRRQIEKISKSREKYAKLYPQIEKFIKKITIKVGRKNNFDGNLLRYLSVSELKNYLKSGRISEGLKQRREKYFYFLAEGRRKETVSADRALIRELYDYFYNINTQVIELRGQSAHRGIARGNVYILGRGKPPKDFILVASMTHPKDIKLIKQSRATVTDEGGILSHAAIINRELKKPCVIGTKIATKVLKDGDLVEVDANKGIVKILKKS